MDYSNYPNGIKAIVAMCRWDRDWLNNVFSQLHLTSNAGGPLEDISTPNRINALAAIIKRIPTPTLATDAENYSRHVLLMLNNPEASLYQPEEIQAIINEIAKIARQSLFQLSTFLSIIIEDDEDIVLEDLIQLISNSQEN